MKLNTWDEAKPILANGGIIAYPTEAVYGLGCDPFNQDAVHRLFLLKQRPQHKGLILLIADWSQLDMLVGTLSEIQRNHLIQTWPGPTTWIFPKAPQIPAWITGGEDTIAIRMSAHPVARALCTEHPLISTSANLSGYPPAKNIQALTEQFPQGIDAIISGELGGMEKPSAIFNVQTGEQLR